MAFVQICELIQQFSGILTKERDKKRLVAALQSRVEVLKIPDLATYYKLLQVPHDKHGHVELSYLMSLVVNTESYFFREQGQFSLLEKYIIPLLIQEASQDKTLRIWIAGCSRGEEAYSIAMLIAELLPDWENWKIAIVGTDIDKKSIELAQEGLFREWSFRSISNYYKEKYFTQEKEGFRIDPKLKKMMTFLWSNLVQDKYPNLLYKIFEVDLIICRNVFIYFHSDATSKVLKKFALSLRPGGFLLTGHGELHDQNIDDFERRIFHGHSIFQRKQK